MNIDNLYRISRDILKLSPEELKWLSTYLKTKGEKTSTSIGAKPRKPKPSLSSSAKYPLPKEKEVADLSSVISKLI